MAHPSGKRDAEFGGESLNRPLFVRSDSETDRFSVLHGPYCATIPFTVKLRLRVTLSLEKEIPRSVEGMPERLSKTESFRFRQVWR